MPDSFSLNLTLLIAFARWSCLQYQSIQRKLLHCGWKLHTAGQGALRCKPLGSSSFKLFRFISFQRPQLSHEVTLSNVGVEAARSCASGSEADLLDALDFYLCDLPSHRTAAASQQALKIFGQSVPLSSGIPWGLLAVPLRQKGKYTPCGRRQLQLRTRLTFFQ